jgi:two-component system OmpR family response regulator
MTSGVRSKVHVVLLVEDNVDLRELYASAMREAGLLVDEVSTVTEAIEVAGELRPDIVVLDRRLPDGDGWDVARALKASQSMNHVPIIAFTSHNQRADVESALVAGCDSFFEKGSTPDALVRHVRGMLGLPLENGDTLSDRTRDRSRPASSLASQFAGRRAGRTS